MPPLCPGDGPAAGRDASLTARVNARPPVGCSCRSAVSAGLPAPRFAARVAAGQDSPHDLEGIGSWPSRCPSTPTPTSCSRATRWRCSSACCSTSRSRWRRPSPARVTWCAGSAMSRPRRNWPSSARSSWRPSSASGQRCTATRRRWRPGCRRCASCWWTPTAATRPRSGRAPGPAVSCWHGSARCPASGRTRRGSSWRCSASSTGCSRKAGGRRPATSAGRAATAPSPTSWTRPRWRRSALTSRA